MNFVIWWMEVGCGRD